MKLIRYMKFAVAILLFELMLGRICYEYGIAQGQGYYISGIWSMWLCAAYALIYCIICLHQGWGETSLGMNIFSTIFLGVPYIASLFVIAFSKEIELAFAVTVMIVFGITLVLEAGILAFQIKRDYFVKKGYKKVSSQ